MLERALDQVKDFKIQGKVMDFAYLKELLRNRFDDKNCLKDECLKIIEIYEYFRWETDTLKSDLKTGH